MLDALDVVLILPRNPKFLENPNQVPSLDLPGTVWIAVFHILLLNMLDALHAVRIVVLNGLKPRNPETVNLAVFRILLFTIPDVVIVVVLLLLNLPRNPDLPGTVTLAVFRILLFDMFGALRVVLLHLNLRHNVKLAVSRYHLTIISPAVWNADPHEE